MTEETKKLQEEIFNLKEINSDLLERIERLEDMIQKSNSFMGA